jgi:two-component system nitrogen regulation response regulator NtrX
MRLDARLKHSGMTDRTDKLLKRFSIKKNSLMANSTHVPQPKPAATLLLVDDEPHLRASMRATLDEPNYHFIEAGDGKTAIKILESEAVDLVLLDLNIPRLSGMDVLKWSLAKLPDLPVIIVSGTGTIAKAVEATKLGAFDYLEKDFKTERLQLAVRNALEKRRLKMQRDRLLAESRERFTLIGDDAAMRKVADFIQHAGRVDSKVLICGESGTGKELVAHAIHLASHRGDHPFVPVNCSAIPETLIESTLFGTAKGAFTDAIDRPGKLQQAQSGTLFLDEIGDMSLMVQAKMLRALEDGVVEPVGGVKTFPVDVRVVSATCKNLQEEISEGNFRLDLFYRINVLTITLPPLRERKSDVRPLSEFLLQKICATHGLPPLTFAPEVWSLLEKHEWPGNVRELQNVLERAAVFAPGEAITSAQLVEAMSVISPPHAPKTHAQTLHEARAQFERDFILQKLNAHEWKIQEAAEELGIQRSHLWKKMKLYGIKS